MKAFLRILGIALALIIGGVVLLQVFVRWRFSEIREKSSPEQRTALESISAQLETIAQKTFTSLDNTFELRYPSTWIPIPADSRDVKNARTILFRAVKFTLQGNSAQLLVTELTVDKALEQIIEDMKESNRKQGWDVEIVNPEIKETEAMFEMIYTNSKTSQTMRSKEKILVAEQEPRKAFNIAVISAADDWKDFEKEAQDIIGSAKLLQ